MCVECEAIWPTNKRVYLVRPDSDNNIDDFQTVFYKENRKEGKKKEKNKGTEKKKKRMRYL